MTDSQAHWDSAYSTKGDSVSWYQIEPTRSLDMIRAVAPMRGVPIIDIGAGASRLADNLITAGYSDLTLLDISEVALARTLERLGRVPNKITWIAADVTQWKPSRKYEVWHDRAVFHFLTDSAAQDAYIAALKQGTKPGSTVILSTFALTGPEKCSGLAVQRYSADTLAARLGPDFAIYTKEVERHHTPSDTTQDFTYAGFFRR
jgi:2-polyprenyl-3-methyl-5-hydroxy-6-metoxy-1,4-benzoquinol methylase